MKLIRNYLYNAFYQVFILIVPFVTTPYLARVLGPKGVGINAYTNSVIQYFILFGSIGVNLYGNRQIAFERDNRKKLTQTFYDIFLLRFFTTFLACLAFIVFLLIVDQYHVYYLAQAIAIVASAFDISWFFMGIENFAITVLRNFFIRMVALISIFVFVRSYDDLIVYILILSISTLLGNLILFPGLRKYIDRPNFSKINIWKHLLPSVSLFIPHIATQVYLVLNKTMLGAMVSVQASGYFEQSDKMIKMVLAVVTTGTVMLPHVANAFAKGENDKVKNYLYSSFSFVTFISMPMMFGLMAVTPKFVPLFFTNRFMSVVPIMVIESIVILPIAWGNVVGSQYLLPTKQNRSFIVSVIIGAIVNLVINIPLIISMGAIGTAIATVISELAVTLYQLLSVRKQIKFKSLFSDFYKYLLAGIVMFIVVLYWDKLLSSSWISLLVEILIGVVVYLIILFLIRASILNKAKDIFFLHKRF